MIEGEHALVFVNLDRTFVAAAFTLNCDTHTVASVRRFPSLDEEAALTSRLNPSRADSFTNRSGSILRIAEEHFHLPEVTAIDVTAMDAVD